MLKGSSQYTEASPLPSPEGEGEAKVPSPVPSGKGWGKAPGEAKVSSPVPLGKGRGKALLGKGWGKAPGCGKALSLSFRRGLGRGLKFLHREDKEFVLQRHATGRKMNDAEPFLLVVDTKRTEQVYILHGSILALKDILERMRKDEFIALSLEA